MILTMIVLYVAFINMCYVIEHGGVELACGCNSSNYSPNNAHSSHWKLCLSQIDTEGYINDS